MIDQQPRHLIIVLVFIRQGGNILLVKQDYGQQYWSLPGGAVEWGESLCRYFPLDSLPELIRPHLRQRVEDFRRDLAHAAWRTQ
jgi:hypothetical protein